MTEQRPPEPAPHRPLEPVEERLWRALAEIVIALPRALDDGFEADAGLSLSEYGVLAALRSAPDHSLRLTALAGATALSLSRVSRLVDAMARRDLCERGRCADDRRGSVAHLTPAGTSALRAAYPHHLARIREHVFDHLDPADLSTLAPALTRLAAALP
jgi:DNA-binding MarR family transcriptional regulator